MRREFYHRPPRPDYVQSSSAARMELFTRLRKEGLIARQNFLCCGSCAGSQIAEDVNKLITTNPKKRDTIKGTVFYHKQDTDLLDRRGILFIRYGQVNVWTKGAEKSEPIGLDDVSIGKIVTKHATELGIPWDWEMDGGSCIALRFDLKGTERGLVRVDPEKKKIIERTAQVLTDRYILAKALGEAHAVMARHGSLHLFKGALPPEVMPMPRLP